MRRYLLILLLIALSLVTLWLTAHSSLFLLLSKTRVWKTDKGLMILPQYKPEGTVNIEEAIISHGYLKESLIDKNLISGRWESYEPKLVPLNLKIPVGFTANEDPTYQEVVLTSRRSKDLISISLYLKNYPAGVDISKYSREVETDLPFLRKRFIERFNLGEAEQLSLEGSDRIYVFKDGTTGIALHLPVTEKFGYYITLINIRTLETPVIKDFLRKLAVGIQIKDLDQENFDRYWKPREPVRAN